MFPPALRGAFASITFLCASLSIPVPAFSQILFSEAFEAYQEGSVLVGQGGWEVNPYVPLFGSITLVATGTGLPSKVSNGRIDAGTGGFGFVIKRIAVPDDSDVYRLSFDAYASSSEPMSHVGLAGFHFSAKNVSWQASNNISVPTQPRDAWSFTVDNITGDPADNFYYSGGFDRPVRFEIVLDVGKSEFYGRYDFGGGFNDTPHFPISSAQISEFTGIQLVNDYRRPDRYLGIEVDNIVLKNFPSNPIDAIELIIAKVVELNLQQGIANSLDAKLSAAINALDDANQNNDIAAVNALAALISSLYAQRGAMIPEDAADSLIEAAQAVINALSQGG